MLLAQDGYASSDRIETGLNEGVIQGAVLSASVRQPDSLAQVVTNLRKTDVSSPFILFDSEFYVGSFTEANKFGKLPGYSYHKHPLKKMDLTNPSSAQAFIRGVVDTQVAAGLDRITSPTVGIHSFSSTSYAHVLSFLFGTEEYVQKVSGEQKLYGSLLIDELALQEGPAFTEFLDDLTAFQGYAGFYIVIDRSRSNAKYWNNPDTLAHLMYLVHSLHENGYEVVIGYSDGDGLLSLAVGATHIASGWWGNTTNFTDSRYRSSGGGRRRTRYYSYQLMNSIYQEGELSQMVEQGFGNKITGGSKLDSDLATDPLNAAWPDAKAILHKWTALDKRIKQIQAVEGETARLAVLEAAILEAQALYGEILNEVDIELEVAHGPQKLAIWLKAIELYRKGVV